ncbi:MAG: tetratricopeptide repeat protein [Planctomycetota bacterium]
MTQRPRAWIFLLALLAFLAYAPSLANDFTMDDRAVAMGSGATKNPMVAELRPLGEYLSSHYWTGLNPWGHLYRPVTVLSYALRHAAVGDSAFAAHLLNVVLHALATLLVFTLIRRLNVRFIPAWIAALVFCLHAIHSEAVAGVVGRAELLAFWFGASALLLLLDSRRFGKAGRSLHLLGVSLLLFLAFGSKESALAWVPFIPVYLWVRRRLAASPEKNDRPWMFLEIACVLLPALLFLWFRSRMLAGLPEGAFLAVDGVVNPIHGAPALTRVLTAVMVWGYGLLLTLFPFHLAADYGAHAFPIVAGFTDAAFALSLIAALALTAVLLLGLAAHRRHPMLFLAMATFLGFSFATSNLLVPIGTIFGERTFYPPSLALSLAVAWVFQKEFLARLSTDVLAAALVLVLTGAWLGVSSSVILARNSTWRDNQTLYLAEAAAHPESVRMQVCAAAVWRERGKLELARHHLEQACALDPGYTNAWNHLGVVYMELGRHEKAVEALRRGMRTRRRELRLHLPELSLNLALALAELGKWSESVRALERSLASNPRFLRRNRLGLELAERIREHADLPAALRMRVSRLFRRLGMDAAPRR